MKKEQILTKKLNAFTLTELLVVLVIIGILVLLALPDHSTVISKAKSREAMLQLKQIHSLETTHFYTYSKYSSDLAEIDFVPPKTVKQNGDANYRYEITSAGASGFQARATAVVDFDQDGTMNVWEIDQNGTPKEMVKD
jgi:type IV pilus assembly protein PilE